MNRFGYWSFFAGLFLLYLFPRTVFAQDSSVTGPTPVPPGTTGIVVPNSLHGTRTIYPGHEQVGVSGQVGDFAVNISGLASPNASVVLTSDGQFVRSTVADIKGYFYLSQVTVRSGFSEFCLEAVDFKRIGESKGCLEFEPVTSSRDFTDIFLPPTVGLFKKEINAGESALIFGYSMPGSKIDLKLRDGNIFKIDADEEGYYEYRYINVPAGTYYFASAAEFGEKKSLEPKKEAELKVLSVPQQVVTRTTGFLEDTGKILTTGILGFLLIMLLLILIIIVILLIILKPAWARALFRRFNRRPLHHDWLLAFVATNSS